MKFFIITFIVTCLVIGILFIIAAIKDYKTPKRRNEIKALTEATRARAIEICNKEKCTYKQAYKQALKERMEKK